MGSRRAPSGACGEVSRAPVVARVRRSARIVVPVVLRRRARCGPRALRHCPTSPLGAPHVIGASHRCQHGPLGAQELLPSSSSSSSEGVLVWCLCVQPVGQVASWFAPSLMSSRPGVWPCPLWRKMCVGGRYRGVAGGGQGLGVRCGGLRSGRSVYELWLLWRWGRGEPERPPRNDSVALQLMRRRLAHDDLVDDTQLREAFRSGEEARPIVAYKGVSRALSPTPSASPRSLSGSSPSYRRCRMPSGRGSATHSR